MADEIIFKDAKGLSRQIRLYEQNQLASVDAHALLAHAKTLQNVLGPEQCVDPPMPQFSASKDELATWILDLQQRLLRSQEVFSGPHESGGIKDELNKASIEQQRLNTLRLQMEELRGDFTRCLKEQEDAAEERGRRLESAVNLTSRRIDEMKAAIQEGEVRREQSESRIMAVIREEAKQREIELDRERKSRESVCTEMVMNWRELLKEEKQIRSQTEEKMGTEISGCVSALRIGQESVNQMRQDLSNSVEELARRIIDEEKKRQSECVQLKVAIEEANAAIQAEVLDRWEAEKAISNKVEDWVNSVQKLSDRLDQELPPINQSIKELAAIDIEEAAAREKGLSTVRTLVAEEVEARENAVSLESQQREAAEAQLKAHWRQLNKDERILREDAEKLLDDRITELQRDFVVEKNRAQIDSSEITQTLDRTRETLDSEVARRAHEVELLMRSIEDIRSGAAEERSLRQEQESHLRREVVSLNAALVEETDARLMAERVAATERTALYQDLQREAGTREASEFALSGKLKEYREAGSRENAESALNGRLALQHKPKLPVPEQAASPQARVLQKTTKERSASPLDRASPMRVMQREKEDHQAATALYQSVLRDARQLAAAETKATSDHRLESSDNAINYELAATRAGLAQGLGRQVRDESRLLRDRGKLATDEYRFARDFALGSTRELSRDSQRLAKDERRLLSDEVRLGADIALPSSPKVGLALAAESRVYRDERQITRDQDRMTIDAVLGNSKQVARDEQRLANDQVSLKYDRQILRDEKQLLRSGDRLLQAESRINQEVKAETKRLARDVELGLAADVALGNKSRLALEQDASKAALKAARSLSPESAQELAIEDAQRRLKQASSPVLSPFTQAALRPVLSPPTQAALRMDNKLLKEERQVLRDESKLSLDKERRAIDQGVAQKYEGRLLRDEGRVAVDREHLKFDAAIGDTKQFARDESRLAKNETALALDRGRLASSKAAESLANRQVKKDERQLSRDDVKVALTADELLGRGSWLHGSTK